MEYKFEELEYKFNGEDFLAYVGCDVHDTTVNGEFDFDYENLLVEEVYDDDGNTPQVSEEHEKYVLQLCKELLENDRGVIEQINEELVANGCMYSAEDDYADYVNDNVCM